ncbi:hypothetical protein [Lentzea aerocolonigenes]|uniref:hypothetical protein n=1 Tax=Lentzea aerocolonigenes TaxID=68170 RepID=UPI0004C39714|nr:hypothetical protein [Lentzea aerocolonigenes]MCP2247958.1 hypothetical protein [Lentzea aerocolonigenes]
MDDEFMLPPDPGELGLPDELPPIRLPDLAVLASQARTSTFLARVRRVATWLDGREVVVEDGDLSTADIAAAEKALGVSGSEFDMLWDLANDLDFIELTDDEARPADGLDEWPDGGDEDVLALWDAAFEFVLTESVWFDGNLDLDIDVNLGPVGPAMTFGLFLADGEGLSRNELSELVQGALSEEADEDLVKAVGDPVPALLEHLRELGAVEITTDTVRLTPLALWCMRERYVAMGVDIGVLPPVEQMTAADLLGAGAFLSEQQSADESRAWLALRAPEQAAQELVSAAAHSNAFERMFAVHLIRSNELGTESLWRSAMNVPELRPYAKTELGVEEVDLTDAAWLLTDLVAASGEVENAFPPGAPDEFVRDMFDAMWRLPHPEVWEVLTMIGEEHPDKKIAKAARKAAFKARS